MSNYNAIFPHMKPTNGIKDLNVLYKNDFHFSDINISNQFFRVITE
jgi:hypothetical protein